MEIQGFSKEFITLLLFFPLMATLVNIFRYVIGFKTFGIYSAIVLAYSFYLTGFRYGVLLLTITFLLVMIAHLITGKIQMHYTSRIATSYTILSIGMLFLLYLISKLPLQNIFDMNIYKVSAIAVLLIVTLTDSIYQQLVNKDFISVLRSFIETLIFATVGLLLMRSQFLTATLYKNAWIIPVLIVANIAIGQYTGLRLLDLLRFRFLTERTNEQTPKEESSKPAYAGRRETVKKN